MTILLYHHSCARLCVCVEEGEDCSFESWKLLSCTELNPVIFKNKKQVWHCSKDSIFPIEHYQRFPTGRGKQDP